MFFMSFLAGSAFQSLSLRKVLLSHSSCLAGALLNGKLPKRSLLSQSLILSLPKEACPVQLPPQLCRDWCQAWRGFDSAGWLFRQVGGLQARIGEVFLWLPIWRCMLCKLCKQSKAKERNGNNRRPKLCYHAKLHGKLPLSNASSGLSQSIHMPGSSLCLSSWEKLPLAALRF